ncbi:glycine betaine ABC transporter substrate-binding protein [Aureibacillus halotolerans]|uniref:Glycine betaine/proline transport system substrate-binding protein n=1 Tax=Aureibacillus halotolerans TaxID=1508390 RepID=A0A4R6TUP6_9BACI|nr:glycine betaine ABC transporter substrate-binding protein [Aureibacillus halotolerans]TDQ35384.1 glycine betaine/proline transport system substrate-binding protein [Aureibacillus halotolerans]
MNHVWKKLGLTAGLSLSLVVAGCGTSGSADGGSADGGDTSGDAGNATANIGESIDYTITGIDPGAGIMTKTEEVIKEYGLDEYSLQTSSGATMTKALETAIENEEPIVVTGWQPHWMFTKFEIKYLEDPKGVYGESETINTMVRKGLEEEMPSAYTVLDQFNWSLEQMGEVMLDVQEGTDIEDASRAWVDENQELVSEWTEGAEPVEGKEIELLYVTWVSEVASTNVLKTVLEDMGFNVTITSLQPQFMFSGLAEGDGDGMVAAWLPVTHGQYMEQFGDQIVDLGPNLEGASTGLAVPSYMDIDSIEDLKAAE